MKYGPFPKWPAFPTSEYYDPLRLPLDDPPLPGITGYRRASLPAIPQTAGPRRLSRVPTMTLRTFSAPIRRKVPQRPLLDQERFPWPSPSRDRLGTLFPTPPGAGSLTTLRQGFTHVADRAVDPAPLRTRPLDHARGLHYQGSRHLPGPDSHRQAIVNLSLLRHLVLLYLRRRSSPGAPRGRSRPELALPDRCSVGQGTRELRLRRCNSKQAPSGGSRRRAQLKRKLVERATADAKSVHSWPYD
jgi:hypothetical protein